MTIETGESLTTPEAARRLGMDPIGVYELIFRGSLRGGLGADGRVYVPLTEVEHYLNQVARAGEEAGRSGDRAL